MVGVDSIQYPSRVVFSNKGEKKFFFFFFNFESIPVVHQGYKKNTESSRLGYGSQGLSPR